MTDDDRGTPNPWSRQGSSEPQDEQPGQGTEGSRPEPAESQASPEHGTGHQPTAEHQAPYGGFGAYPAGTPPYGAAPYGMPPYGPGPQSSSLYPAPPVSQSGQRSGPGKIVIIAAIVGLLAGGAAGGIGGYLVASDTIETPTVNALDQPRPAKETIDAPQGSVEAVAQKVTPSVVQLEVATGEGTGEGSGFVLTDNGYILTNNHVVESAEDGGNLRVVFQNGRSVPGSVVGTDPTTDIAVVKAEGVTGLRPVELGRSDDLDVGEHVVAIGSPYELSGTVTSGIISALHRPVSAGGNAGGLASVMDAIQTDAAINPGNSGGPLMDMSGRVIGINSAIYSPGSPLPGSSSGNVGIGFAIPIDQARRVAEEIMKTGKATQSYIGALVSDARGGGATIRKVEPNGPAADAGVKAGDVVIRVGSRLIADSDELVAAIRAKAPGEQVDFTLRGGEAITVTLGAKTVGG